MGEQIKNMMVGLVMLSACAFTIALILFLKPSVGDEKKTYDLRFSNINGIGIGTRVLFAGRPVGEVVSIHEIQDARQEPTDSLGRLYFYQLEIRVDSSVTLYNTDEVTIQTSGLLGEKSIAIIPMQPHKGQIVRPIMHEPIYAQSADSLEIAFFQLSKLAETMDDTFSFMHSWMKKNEKALSGTVVSLEEAVKAADQFLKDINQQQLVQSAKQGIDHFSNTMASMQSAMQQLQEQQFFSHLSSIACNIDKTTNSISSGKGTLGKLIEQDDLYLQVVSLLSKADTLMNDVNQYGILFHLNKTWQRTRLQKVTLLNSLQSPSSFQSYFENEVQEVNLAMARLSMLLQKAEKNPEKQAIFRSGQFTKQFAEFLREVDTLADNVRLYNEQLMHMQHEGNTNEFCPPCTCP